MWVILLSVQTPSRNCRLDQFISTNSGRMSPSGDQVKSALLCPTDSPTEYSNLWFRYSWFTSLLQIGCWISSGLRMGWEVEELCWQPLLCGINLTVHHLTTNQHYRVSCVPHQWVSSMLHQPQGTKKPRKVGKCMMFIVQQLCKPKGIRLCFVKCDVSPWMFPLQGSKYTWEPSFLHHSWSHVSPFFRIGCHQSAATTQWDTWNRSPVLQAPSRCQNWWIISLDHGWQDQVTSEAGSVLIDPISGYFFE